MNCDDRIRLQFSSAWKAFCFSLVEVIVLCAAALLSNEAIAQTPRSSFSAPPPTISVTDLAVPKSAQQQYNKAREAAMKGDYDVSFKSVRLVLERYPHFPAALTLRGILRFERGNLEGAELDFQQAIVLSPNDVAAYTSLIGLYADLKRFDDARYCAQRALSLAPHAWSVHLQAGYLEYRTGHFDDTVKYVGQAERLLSADVLPPARAKLYILRGYALLELSRTTEARNDFERALRYSSPGSVYADVADKQLQRLQTYMSDGLGVAPTTK